MKALLGDLDRLLEIDSSSSAFAWQVFQELCVCKLKLKASGSEVCARDLQKPKDGTMIKAFAKVSGASLKKNLATAGVII